MEVAPQMKVPTNKSIKRDITNLIGASDFPVASVLMQTSRLQTSDLIIFVRCLKLKNMKGERQLPFHVKY